jgi:hypothetical protein
LRRSLDDAKIADELRAAAEELILKIKVLVGAKVPSWR